MSALTPWSESWSKPVNTPKFGLKTRPERGNPPVKRRRRTDKKTQKALKTIPPINPNPTRTPTKARHLKALPIVTTTKPKSATQKLAPTRRVISRRRPTTPAAKRRKAEEVVPVKRRKRNLPAAAAMEGMGWVQSVHLHRLNCRVKGKWIWTLHVNNHTLCLILTTLRWFMLRLTTDHIPREECVVLLLTMFPHHPTRMQA